MKKAEKKWYFSKTLIASMVGLICTALQLWKGWLIGPEYQATIAFVIMGILRPLTNNRVVFRESSHGDLPVSATPDGTVSADQVDPSAVGGEQ